ncbi:MAG: hypothetical protein K9W43_05615 [Candidatus Thorarchaeota archaeon]|nr:hypothetical protein [Candidatus Thorarchaeota archaeon]
MTTVTKSATESLLQDEVTTDFPVDTVDNVDSRYKVFAREHYVRLSILTALLGIFSVLMNVVSFSATMVIFDFVIAGSSLSLLRFAYSREKQLMTIFLLFQFFESSFFLVFFFSPYQVLGSSSFLLITLMAPSMIAMGATSLLSLIGIGAFQPSTTPKFKALHLSIFGLTIGFLFPLLIDYSVYSISFIITYILMALYVPAIIFYKGAKSGRRILIFPSSLTILACLSLLYLGWLPSLPDRFGHPANFFFLSLIFMHLVTVVESYLISVRMGGTTRLPLGRWSLHIKPTWSIGSRSKHGLTILTGYDAIGETLKIAIKVKNDQSLSIMNVAVLLDLPDGLELRDDSEPIQRLGNIPPGKFQSAIFWARPLRCLDDDFSGVVRFQDARGVKQTIEIPPKRIVNICPMLSSTENAESIFKELKYNTLARNCASFKFNGVSRTVFELAQARLTGLSALDLSEKTFEDGTYLGYSYYVGETKYGQQHFAVEIQVTGLNGSGILTLTVYSEDQRILSGFFADVMPSIREHISIIEEQACPLLTCPKCGASIDPSKIDDERLYHCTYCGVYTKIAPWLLE